MEVSLQEATAAISLQSIQAIKKEREKSIAKALSIPCWKDGKNIPPSKERHDNFQLQASPDPFPAKRFVKVSGYARLRRLLMTLLFKIIANHYKFLNKTYFHSGHDGRLFWCIRLVRITFFSSDCNCFLCWGRDASVRCSWRQLSFMWCSHFILVVQDLHSTCLAMEPPTTVIWLFFDDKKVRC